MARTLASAWVNVGPSGFATFGKVTQAKVKAALRNVSASVPVQANTTPASTSLDKLKARLAEFSRTVVTARADASTKDGQAALARMDVALDKLGRKVSSPRVTLEGIKAAEAELLGFEATFDRLDKKKLSASLPGGGSGGGSSGGGLLSALAPAGQGLANPYTIAAGLAILPFAAQAAAGGMVAALGGGLAAIAIAGAARTKSVQNSFDRLKKSASSDLTEIGKSFVPVLNSILGTARSTLGKLTPVFAGAAKTISGPFQQFTDTLVRSFASPNMKNAIQGVANAFGSILKALTPQLPGDINTIADGIKRVAAAVSANPKAFADFVSGLLRAAGIGLDVVAGLTVAATYIENHFLPALGRIAIFALTTTKSVTDAFLSMTGSILHGLVDAFGWIPGLGGKLRGASRSFDAFKAGVDANFDAMVKSTKGWISSVDGTASAVKNATGKITGDFGRQSKAADAARDALRGYTDAITTNGVSSGKAKSEREKLITDLIKAGVNAGTARTDVGKYTDAVSVNGVRSDQARNARARLNDDIIAAFKNSRQGKADLSKFTDAVTHNSSQSDAVRGARARLIGDLERSGIDANTAKRLVDTLQTAINRLHGKTVDVGVHGSGSGGVKIVTSGIAAAGQGNVRFVSGSFAAGGLVKMGSGPTADDVVARLSKGELVIPAGMVKAGVVDHLRGVLPGFASGGLVGMLGRVPGQVAGFAGHAAGLAELAAAKAAIAREKKALASSFAAVPVRNVGSGVARWAGVVRQALAMEHLNPNLILAVLYQMLTESGGNPNAINLSDINAQHGDPSRGLMQVIGSTFRAYHWPGTSGNIYDPLANVAAALNYARHRYGPSLISGGMGIGSGHGYALGGLVKSFDHGGWLRPGLNLAFNGTGRPEPVGTGTITVEAHVHAHGPIGSQAELETWLVKSVNNLARTGRLTQAVKRAGG